MYSYVQQKYWSVGLLQYWNFGNIVFIALGLPAIAVSLIGLVKVYRFSLPVSQQALYLSFLLLLLVTILLTNIQSSTRFLSTHPIFILLLADLAARWSIIRIGILSYYFCGLVMYPVAYPWT
jgi:Gpi18-like mannosyltransferase